MIDIQIINFTKKFLSYFLGFNFLYFLEKQWQKFFGFGLPATAYIPNFGRKIGRYLALSGLDWLGLCKKLSCYLFAVKMYLIRIFWCLHAIALGSPHTRG